MAVPRGSPHPREAIELIRFLLQRDSENLRADKLSQIPKDLELFDLPAILEPYSELAKLKQHREPVVARPSIVSGEKYEDVSRAYIRSLHTVLTGESSAPLAAAGLEKELMEITGFRKGPVPKQH